MNYRYKFPFEVRVSNHFKIVIQETIVKEHNILFCKLARVGGPPWTKLIMY